MVLKCLIIKYSEWSEWCGSVYETVLSDICGLTIVVHKICPKMCFLYSDNELISISLWLHVFSCDTNLFSSSYMIYLMWGGYLSIRYIGLPMCVCVKRNTWKQHHCMMQIQQNNHCSRVYVYACMHTVYTSSCIKPSKTYNAWYTDGTLFTTTYLW